MDPMSPRPARLDRRGAHPSPREAAIAGSLEPRLRAREHFAVTRAEVTMGDKSPKSKRRAQKQKAEAKKDAAGKTASKQPKPTPPPPSNDDP
jgi:hypothetical protein